MQQLITNIKTLVNVRPTSSLLRGKAMAELPTLQQAFLLIENGSIKDYGLMAHLPYESDRNTLDAKDSTVLPCWCDSHTHLVFATTREDEFVDKIKGKSYAEIAAKGGGILNSAMKVALSTEEELYNSAWQRLQQVMRLGTGAIEIKSGYGLDTENELKILHVTQKIKQDAPIPVKATFLGAHAVPLLYQNKKENYIKLLIEEMLPAIANEGLADYIDVFCEAGFYTQEETERICEAGISYGLKPKIHANQLSLSGGVQAGVNVKAISVDHLEMMDDEATQLLASSNTIGTLLPTAAFFLRMPLQPARALIDAGCAVALASDYNPGSSPSGNMNFVVSLGCIGMRMLPEEAINAATLNGAYAMNVEADCGSITVGKKANLIFMKDIPSLAYIPYSFGSNLIKKVMIGGRFLE